jgi:hypothetical protein
VFWIEAEAFDWNDAVIYMAMTVASKTVTANNAARAVSVVLADFSGGDPGFAT